MAAIVQTIQTGWARSFELSTDGGVTWHQLAGQDGRELVMYNYGITRPTNPTDTGSAAQAMELIGTFEYALTADGSYSDDNVDLLEP